MSATALRYCIAVVVSGLAASMAEWFFSGDLWMILYLRYPDTWRSTKDAGYSERNGIIVATFFACVSAAIFLFICHHHGIHGYAHPLILAVLLWIALPLPLLLTQSCFMKYPPALAMVHAAGWLSKLVIFAVAVGLSGL